MNEAHEDTKKNDSDTKVKNGFNNYLKDLDEQQSNENIIMKDKEIHTNNSNGNIVQTPELKPDNLGKEETHLNDLTARRLPKKDNILPNLSDTNSSHSPLSSLSSSSDEEVIESFTVHNDNVKEASGSFEISDDGSHEDGIVDKDVSKQSKALLKEPLSSANQRNMMLAGKTEEIQRANGESMKKDKEQANDSVEDPLTLELQAQLDSLTQNRNDLQKHLEITKEQYDKLVSLYEDSRKCNERLKKDITNLSSVSENQNKEISDLKRQLELTRRDAEHKEKEQSSSLAFFEEELTKVQASIEIKEQEVNKLRNQLEETKAELNLKESEFKKELEEVRKGFESLEIEQLNKIIDDATLKTESQSQEIDKLNNELEAAKKQLYIESKEYEKTQQLTGELSETKSKLDDKEQEISVLKGQLEAAQKEIESKEGDLHGIERLKEDLDSAKSAGENQHQVILELTDKLDMAKNKYDSKNGDEERIQLRDELVNAKATIRSMNQANSKLEAKLSNAQTVIETREVEQKKSREEIRALKDKVKWLERRRASERESTPMSTPRSEGSPREDIEQKLKHESLRRTQERIRELEQKVIKVNEEKQKLKTDYEEAVKALEAVDKVYSVRELALQQYKTDLEDANNTIKQQSTETLQFKMEADQMRKEIEQAEEAQKHQEQLQEDLKDQLTRSKELAAIYKTEIEEVRKEFRDQMHELQMAQARARERGKKIQILELELNENKESLQISKNVIVEKQKNMEHLQESIANEKKNCKKLEQELDEMFYLAKKLQLIEDEKARVVEKLKRTEKELEDTTKALNNSNKENKDIEKQMESLKENHSILCDKSEDQKYQIQSLRSIADSKEADIEQQVLEIIHYRDQLDNLTLQLQELWATYNADKSLGKTGKSSRRRPHSASMKRTPKSPSYQTAASKPHSYAHRRLVNKLGEPVINQSYINSTHKSFPTLQPVKLETQSELNGTSSLEKSPPQEGIECSPSPKLSPRPPNGTKPRPSSSYGVRTYPPMNSEIQEDVWMYRDCSSSVSGDADDQIVNFLVNIGDRVLIQSKVVGEELLNVSGVVRFVGKVGTKSNTSPTYVGLKLDQPFGDSNGIIGGKQMFKCPPRHGKLIKMSDVCAIMQPRTQNYTRVKASTATW